MSEPARTALRACPLCEAACGLALTVGDDGRVAGIRGHDADVFSRGFICPKGAALGELHADPDRLRTPLVKKGGRFVAVSWDEAFAEIERRLAPILARGDRDAVAMSIGNPAAHKAGLLLYGARLARALGSRNIFSASTLDQMPKQLAAGLLFGHWLSIPVPDIERADLLIVLGANPCVSNGSLWTVPDFRGKARALRARGGRLVVIDPRRTETAAIADEHLFIRPGGDAFLLLGIVHTLFAEGLVRLGRLAEHVAGEGELRAATAPFAADVVAPRCGVDASRIRDLARALARAERGAIYGRIGTCTQAYGTLASWLVDVINVLTGHLDEPGGAMFPRAAAFAANTMGPPGRGRGVSVGRRKSRVSGAPEVFGELPMGCLAEEIERPGAGQIRALVTSASNPVLSAPNGARLSAALESLELMVSVDVYVNETTRHAHVLLPGSSPLEEMHFDVAFPQLAYKNYARYSAPIFARPEGQPAEWEILLRLTAIAMGQGAGADLARLDDELTAAEASKMVGSAASAIVAASPFRGPERLIDLALRAGPYGLDLARVREAPDGIDLGPLAPRVPEVLRTPSGKIELAPPLLVADLARAAADLAPRSEELVVIGRRQLRSNNSWMHNLPMLAKGPPRCTALVHPDDAARLGLVDGGAARITGPRGAIVLEVAVTDEMMRGVVSVPHGFGHDLPGVQLGVASERPGANLNAILDEDARDPLSGNAVLGGVPVRVEPVT